MSFKSNAIVVVFLTFVLWTLDANAQSCPKIVTRSQWGAAKAKEVTRMKAAAKYVFIHHTTGSTCNSQAACSKSVKNIKTYHQNTQGWSDIGYSFLVGNDGAIYEGRGWGVVGAHTIGYNSNGIAFSFIGDFTNQLPSQKAIDAVKKMIACGVKQGKIQSNYGLLGHRAVYATACPGNKLYNLIKSWPHFRAKP